MRNQSRTDQELGGQEDAGVMSTATATRMPGLYCPIEPAIHPNTREINAAGLDWISTSKVFGRQPSCPRRLLRTLARRIPPSGDDRRSTAAAGIDLVT
jgi:hypothetical protein